MAIKTPVAAWFTPFISGMNLAYATTTTFTVAAGVASNGNTIANSNLITIDSAVTITTTVSGAGGLDTGTIAASTKYYVYAIGASAYPDSGLNDQTTGYVNAYPGSALISASTSPTLPLNYDMYRYLGTVYTDGSSHFLSFYQTGTGTRRPMYYDAGISVLSAGTSTTYASVSLATAVPTAGLDVIVTTSLTPNSSASVINLAPYGSSSTNGLAQIKGQVAAVVNTVTSQLPSASNAGVPYILYKTTSGSDSVSMVVTGYIDQL